MESIFTFVNKLKIEKGDLLVFRVTKKEQLDNLKTPIAKLAEMVGSRGGLILFIQDDIEIEKLPPEQMEKHGWIRKDDT